MNFTREPIIETIITPKEGNKLIVRNSKGGAGEEYIVDAVEVVSFGHSFFFRSLERPKSFLLPVGDYEVIETKETRVVLKNAPLERSVKIAGGKQARPSKDVEDTEEGVAQHSEHSHGNQDDRSKRRKGLRRRRGEDRHEQHREHQAPRAEITPPIAPIEKENVNAELNLAKGQAAHDEPQVSSSMFRSLFPPPAQLISDNIHRYKNQEAHTGTAFSEDARNQPKVVPTEGEVKSHHSEDGDDHHKMNNSHSNGPRYHQAPKLPDENQSQDSQSKTIDLGMDHNFIT